MSRTTTERTAIAIAEALGEEAPAGAEFARYVETALGGADDAALLALLDDPDDAEGEVLRELLLFPGEDVKLALEPLLTDPAVDDSELGAALAEHGPVLLVRLPQGETAELRPTGEECLVLVRRLRAQHGVPEELGAVVDEALPAREALRVRLRLRHSRCPWSRRNTRLLETLAGSRRTERETLPDLLQFLAGVLTDLPDGADVLGALRDRYETARAHLEANARFLERLARDNYETLALRGERAPHADPDYLRREMLFADAAALALFGARAAAPALRAEDLGVFDPADISRLLGLPQKSDNAAQTPDGMPDLPSLDD